MDDLNTTSEVLDVATARQRLTEVRPVVETIMHLAREARATDAQRAEAVRLGDRALENQLNSGLADKRTELQERIRELNRLGAILKDPMNGLIDFYTWAGGDMAFLCWRHGEDTIEYWHGLEDGYPGRRPVAELGEPS
ncbi:MAG: hypothetical protein CMJ83_13110 [Planctomycetes bacterium]|nr:hypothetical protein [Planctomycetota bacterium]